MNAFLLRLARLSAAVAASILIAGCSVYRPRTELVTRLELGDSFLDTGVEAPGRWWEQLEDPELSRVIEATLNDNLSLRIAWSRLDQMRAVARTAGAGRFPSVDLALGAERQELAGDGHGAVDTRFASLTAGYQVDLWKKIGHRRKAAIYDQQSSRWDVESTAIALTAAAGELWYGIAADQATVKLLNEQVELGEEYLDLVQLRFANGLVSAVDVLQQRLQVESTRNQIPASTTRLARRQHQMAILLGREPRADTPLPAAVLPPLPPLPATGVPLEVLRSRPDVRAAELRFLAADHRLAAAVADRFPSLRLTATMGGQAEGFADVLDRWYLHLAGNLLAPIVAGGRLAAEADRHRAVVEERFYAWESALLEACTEVEDALAAERGLEETIRILDDQLELAAENLKRSRALYLNGLTDYLTVLTALQTLQGLERQSVAIRQDLLTNRIRLYVALGGSWSRTLEAPTSSVEELS